MEVLLFFQQFRNSFLETVALWITKLGEEYVVMTVLCALYWCISKKNAMRIGFTYFISGMIVQILKIIFMIERPWVGGMIQPSNEARIKATGYSFPSGHTQGATALYGNLAYLFKNTAMKALMIFIFTIVAVSRMFLGVHTPLDVSAALCISLATVVAVNVAIDSRVVYRFSRESIFAALMAVTVFFLTYGLLRFNTKTIDIVNLKDYIKACGAAFGFAGGWYLEGKYLCFNEKTGGIINKSIRLMAGLTLLIGIKEGGKVVLNHFFGMFLTGDSKTIIVALINYGLIVFFAIFLYPYLFTKFTKKTNICSVGGEC